MRYKLSAEFVMGAWKAVIREVETEKRVDEEMFLRHAEIGRATEKAFEDEMELAKFEPYEGVNNGMIYEGYCNTICIKTAEELLEWHRAQEVEHESD